MDNEEVILTQEGYDKIEENLEELKTKVRDEIRERIKVALSYGDLSENSEYDEAKAPNGIMQFKVLSITI